jgi:hypothetical protein
MAQSADVDNGHATGMELARPSCGITAARGRFAGLEDFQIAERVPAF